MTRAITSRRHPLVLACREARGGGDDQPLLLDGWHLLVEAVRSSLDVDAVLVAASPPGPAEREALEALAERGAQVVEASADVLHAASPVRTPVGVVALARRPASALDRIFAPPPALVVATLDVQDPGNLGALVRTAEALGATGLVATGGSADPLGWKALRASMGSAFRLPTARAADAEALIAEARARGLRIIALEPSDGRGPAELDLREPLCLLLGGEGQGMPASVLALADARMRLPMRPPVESLNVAVAGALALQAAASQRQGVVSGGLFDDETGGAPPPPAPLAERMRPRTLDEIVGQEALLAPGKPLREAIQRDVLQSAILWGPPGSGKTTLARVIAAVTDAEFVAFSAVLAGIKEIKEVMAAAEQRRRRGRRTIVFVDEIHRFNKAQQDAFLPRVESGDIVLIGATTENPSFEVNAALLSRSKVFVLQPLSEAALMRILEQAIADDERGLGRDRPEVSADALGALARAADGDARRALNLLQLTVAAAPQAVGHARVDLALVQQTLQRKTLRYDKDGEEHFNLMSALHKSMRNSDPDASVYWLARMVEAGEDPMYVARRLVRFASEDVGNADPQALVVAMSARDALHFIGMPEGNTALAQAVLYLATAPKSNATYLAYGAAAEAAEHDVAEPVPLHLRNAPTRLMKSLDYGRGYQYAHDDPDAVADMECLPERLAGRQFYAPTERGFEKEIKRRLEGWKEIKARRRQNSG